MRKESEDTMKEYEKPWQYGPLKVMDNGRYFSCGDKPFFWMADTAWLLFHQLTIEESYCYLRNRKELGFNVIFVDFLHEENQINCKGEHALVEENISTLNLTEGFWNHVDQVIHLAENLGLYMAILPVWGSNLVNRKKLNLENIDEFMDGILERYHDAPNIIWIVGGDVRGSVNKELFQKMGRRMKADNQSRLVGYHPFGRTSSSLWFHEETWLDFNLFQSGHRRYDQINLGKWDDNTLVEDNFGEDCWRYVERDYNKLPVKPVLDGEPSYEWILQGLHDETQPYWKEHDVRRYAYWDVFAGAAGHTYGHNAVMQFHKDIKQKGSFGVKHIWEEAMHHPGGIQMSHLVSLINSVDFTTGRPSQEYLLSSPGDKYDRISVFAGEGFIFAYTYQGKPIHLLLQDYVTKELDAYWYEPTSGVKSFIQCVNHQREVLFIPPSKEDGQVKDMVLLLLSV